MLTRENFLNCGSIIKTHGAHGHLKVAFSEHFTPEYHKGDWLFLACHEKPVPFFIEAVEYPADEMPVIKLADIDSPEAALPFVKKAVLFPIEALDSPEEHTLAFLTLHDYALYDQHHAFRGTIEAIEPQADQFLLTIRSPNGQTLLMPCHPTMVIALDHKEKQMVMECPEGIDEL